MPQLDELAQADGTSASHEAATRHPTLTDLPAARQLNATSLLAKHVQAVFAERAAARAATAVAEHVRAA